MSFTPMRTRGPLSTKHHRIAVAAALGVAFVGTLLPGWTATIPTASVSVSAITGDGLLLLAVLGFSAFCQLIVVGMWQARVALLSAIAGAALAADFIRRYVNLVDEAPGGAVITFGSGVPVMLVGAVAMVWLAWTQTGSDKPSASEPEQTTE